MVFVERLTAVQLEVALDSSWSNAATDIGKYRAPTSRPILDEVRQNNFREARHPGTNLFLIG